MQAAATSGSRQAGWLGIQGRLMLSFNILAAMASAAALSSCLFALQIVASAAGQLSASSSEISRQIAQSARITGKGVSDARRTNAIAQALSAAAEKVGDVV